MLRAFEILSGFLGDADLVGDGLGVRPPLEGDPRNGGTGPEGCAGEAEGVHGRLSRGQLMGVGFGRSFSRVGRCVSAMVRIWGPLGGNCSHVKYHVNWPCVSSSGPTSERDMGERCWL